MKLKTSLIFSAMLAWGLQTHASEALDCSVDANANAVITGYKGVTGSAARTIECWVKATANNQMFLGYGSTQGSAGTVINMGTNGSSSQGALGAFRVEVGASAYVSSTVITDGQWHHVAVTFSGNSSDTLQIWVNGTMEDNVPHAAATINTSSGVDLRIGSDQNASRDFSGQVDELRIWNVELSQSQLQNLANQQLGYNGADPKEVAVDPTLLWSNLEAYYTFDALDGSGEIPDFSDNVRPAALANNATLTTGDGGKPLDTLTPVIGLEMSQENQSLKWSVSQEIGVSHYLIQQFNNGTWTTIEQLAAGHNQYETLLPNDQGARLLVVDHSGFVQTFSPNQAANSLQIYHLQAGWNLISTPGMADLTEWPETVTTWGWYDQEYVSTTTTQAGQGIWVWSEIDQTLDLHVKAAEAAPVVNGWNLIGPIENEEIPTEFSDIYTWNGQYNAFAEDGLWLQGIGYWAYQKSTK